MRFLPRSLALAGLALIASAGHAADLVITIENIESAEGSLTWVLYASAAAYASNSEAKFSARARVDGETLSLTLHDLPPARYAIKLFHDANDNGELDRNALGLPTEGYGFSNNAGRFGPPSFEDAAIELGAENTTLTISVR